MHSLPRYRPVSWWKQQPMPSSAVTHSEMLYRGIWCDLCGTVDHDGVWLLRQWTLNYCRDCIGTAAQKALEIWVDTGKVVTPELLNGIYVHDARAT